MLTEKLNAAYCVYTKSHVLILDLSPTGAHLPNRVSASVSIVHYEMTPRTTRVPLTNQPHRLHMMLFCEPECRARARRASCLLTWESFLDQRPSQEELKQSDNHLCSYMNQFLVSLKRAHRKRGCRNGTGPLFFDW